MSTWVVPRRVACALSVVCAICVAACASPGSQSKDAAAPDGARLFAQACSKCHGEDGSGGLPMAEHGPKPIDFRSSDWQGSRSDAEITAAIRDGRGAMPPFHELLKPPEIAALTRYVRQLGATSR